MTARICPELDGRPCPYSKCAELGCFVIRKLAAMRADQAAQTARRLAHRAAQPVIMPGRPAKAERPRCGATTRSGGTCRAPAVWDHGASAPRNGRCRVHGGLSTGPRTAEGRQRIAEAQRRRWSQLGDDNLPRGAGERGEVV